MSSMSPLIRRLDHLQIAIPEGGEPQARQFYCDLLGFIEEQKPEPLAQRGGCWLRSGEAVVHLGIDEDFRAATKAHPAFVVEGFNDLINVLSAAGSEVTRDHELAGVVRGFVKDPFGNRIELIAASEVEPKP